MGWRAKAGREQKRMAMSIWRLLDLADMAEQAAGRPFWVRWCVLWAAWQANAFLRDYFDGSVRSPAGRRWPSMLMPAGFGSDPADAQDLAASLRAFGLFMQATAAQLRLLAFLHRGQGCDAAGNEGGPRHGVLRRLPDTAVAPVELRDTS